MIRVVISVALAVTINAHSWLTCTDYLEENGEYWSSTLCRAYPRHANKYANKEQFGLDRGYNHFSSENAPCKTGRDDISGYDSNYPMAVYYPGQRIVLTHPMKNHGADPRCTNKYIPDNGMKLYMYQKNGDVKLSEYESNPIWDFGKSPNGQNNGYQVAESLLTTYPKPGFQNAPKFCENTDKALATMTFEVPKNIRPGRYSFLWLWWFNSRNDEYAGCFEADIVANKEERDAKLNSRGQTTEAPVNIAPGGRTSGGTPLTGSGTGGGTVTNEPTRRPIVGGPTTSLTPIDGGWGDYSSWSLCTVTCGGGVKRRVRYCNNPRPQNGGKMCAGSNEESSGCNTKLCPSTGGTTLDNLKAIYTVEWGHGANGEIILPASRSATTVYVVTFPCPVENLSVWNVDDISTSSEKSNGIYSFRQTQAWQHEKPSIGFTVQFGACRTGADAILVTARSA